MEILHGSTDIICQTDKMMNKGTYVGVIIFLKLHAAIKYYIQFTHLFWLWFFNSFEMLQVIFNEIYALLHSSSIKLD